MLGFASSAPTYQSRSFMNDSQKPAPSAGPGGGVSESVRGQDDRKRERQARDGVSRPAGGARPVARGFPGSWHPAKVRGQGGKALCPLAAPAKREVGKPPKPTKGGTDPIQSTHQTGFDHPSTGSGRPDWVRGTRWASQAQRQPTRAKPRAGFGSEPSGRLATRPD